MDTCVLIDIAKTRIAASEGNPTGRSFLYEVVKALERLQKFEEEAVGDRDREI